MKHEILRIAFFGVAVASSASAQVTQRVSVDSSGMQGNDFSSYSRISADGRYVAFASRSSNFVAGDNNGVLDVFLRDRVLGTTECLSMDSGGGVGTSESVDPSVSADGRYVAFTSYAVNLIIGDSNGTSDIFVRDRQLGTTERVSVSSTGAQGSSHSGNPSISADGRFVAFWSYSTLVPGDTSTADIYVRDRLLGTTERVSVSSTGVPGNDGSAYAHISADGRYVAFESSATNLVPGDTNNVTDVFVHDRQLGVTERASVDSNGVQGTATCNDLAISADGRYVAFMSAATNLVPGDTNGVRDIFVRDLQLGLLENVHLDSSGVQGDGPAFGPALSGDGRYVVFGSAASNLVPGGDATGDTDVYLRDRQSGTTERVAVDSAGVQGNQGSYRPWISGDGRYVTFPAAATNLVAGDTNARQDVFVRDRFGGPSFTTLCDPGVGGVLACPCANLPSGPGRGCNNSSNTGGASLSASGGTYLSSDSLVFTTSGEKPTALSIVAQWNGSSAGGVVFGMGVRCTSGALKRLYTKSAVGGSISAPNYGAGELQVSVRSNALGDPIAAGQSRWYLVYYRDPIVLGGCPAASTFNATQSGEVAWSP